MFGRFAADVDFDADLQIGQLRRALIAQAAGEFGAVERVQPVRAFGHRPAFVGLDVADNVPEQTGAVGQRFGLELPFADVVFAEIALAERVKSADVGGGKGFAHRNQPHRAGIPARLPLRRADALFYRCQSLRLIHRTLPKQKGDYSAKAA